MDLSRFFGALISALYKVNEKENELKHAVVYKEVCRYPGIMEEAFRLSLQISRNTTVTSNVEKGVLELSLQVTILVLKHTYIFEHFIL